MSYLTVLPICLVVPYFLWACTLSDRLFHRVCSLSLCSLFWLAHQSSLLPASIYYLLTTLNCLLCLALSPLPAILYHQRSTYNAQERLSVIWPEAESATAGDTPVADIVFVHGLAANPLTTWNTRSSTQSWIRDFLPNENLNCRIMQFSHNTVWEANALSKSLSDHGDDLVQALNIKRRRPEEKCRPLIFIGHSFGGLIIKQAVMNALEQKADFCLDINQQAQGFIFLGTPHKGSQITWFGEVISMLGFWKGSSTNLLEIIKPGSQVNQQLHKAFASWLVESGKIKNTVCVFETVMETAFSIPITHVVDQNSAVIDGSHTFGAEKGHRDMQRYSRPDDPDYQKILYWIWKWVQEEEEIKLAIQAKMEQKRTEEQNHCLQSLYFEEMNHRANDINREAENTCGWLIEKDEYKTWLAQDQGLLGIRGNPGAGKSTLLNYAHRTFVPQEGPNKEITASFFFHGRGADIQKSPLGLFRSLAHQLSDQIPDLCQELTTIFRKRCATYGKHGEKWNWNETDLRDFLCISIPRVSQKVRIRIFVDAIDECALDKHGNDATDDLLCFFESLTSSKPAETAPRVCICSSRRHHPMSVPEHGAVICVEHENKQDIRTYIEETLRKEIPNEEQVQKITNKIVSKASGIFQWVSLVVRKVIRQFRSGANTTTILKEIDNLPSELAGLYEDILAHLEDRPKSLLLMQWICFAVWPLSLGEIRFAFVVDPAKPYTSLKEYEEDDGDFPETDEQMERKLKSLSGGLAEVQDRKGARIVQFIHQSVQDYLKQKGLQKLDESPTTAADERKEKDIEAEAHFRMSRSCIRYLNMNEVLSIPEWLEEWERQQLYNDFPFIRYCVINWVAHAKTVEKHGIRQHDLPQMFQWPSDQAIQLWAPLNIMMVPFSKNRPTRGMCFLHVASQHGLVTTIKAIFSESNGVEMDPKDYAGRTPLSYAAENGHEAVIKLLLKTGANLNAKNYIGFTPLWWAVVYKQKAVVKLLLENGADPNAKHNYGLMPLTYAVKEENEAMIKLLLENGADPNAKDNYGTPPLLWAILKKEEEAVRLLLENGADPNLIDIENGRTPLLQAAADGNAAVVEVLLEKGANPDSKDNAGRTPLICAAAYGHETVVSMLLAKNIVDWRTQDPYGQTPLLLAAGNGHEAIVKLLISRDVTGLFSKDKFGRTPLSWAAQKGYSNIVKILCEKYCENGEVVHAEDITLGTPRAPDQQCWLSCDICMSCIPDIDIHHHCGICQHGDFDLCQDCLHCGAFCLDDSHKMVKWTVKNGAFVKLTD